MKKFTIITSLIISIIFMGLPVVSVSQIMITSGEEVTAEDLVASFVGEGVQYYNVQYIGAEDAKGMFTNGYSTNLGLDQGIILTSGCADILQGPNYNTGASCAHGLGGDDMFMICWGMSSLDASVLTFDVIPESDTLRFKYVFGSEEYPEFVQAMYSDLFGIFVSGPDPDGGEYVNKNIAIVPGSDPELPVNINTINNVIPSYEWFYVDNTGGMTIEYDGFTVVLTAWLKVIACEEYHFHIAIADQGDYIWDSGVCLEAKSITRPLITVESDVYPQGVSGDMIEGCVETDLFFRLPNESYSPRTVEFEILSGPGYATNGVDYEYIDPFIIFEEGEDSLAIHIIPIYDGILEGDELISLVITNDLGCIVRYDTVTFVIQDYVQMVDTISPPTVTCEGCSVDLWVQVSNGIPPFAYLWEPGGYTNDTITIDCEEPGVFPYMVTITDMCLDTLIDSTSVTVFPITDFESYYFEAALNLGLEEDVFGELLNDTVFVLLPPGTDPNGLIASFTCDGGWVAIHVDGVYQEPGVTPNDFTNPVVYVIFGAGGNASYWTVICEVEVGQNEIQNNQIQIFPNPAKEQLNILHANGYEVSIVSNTGTEVYTHRIDKQKQTINITHLEPGIYYLRFEKEEEEFVRKVVIER